MRIVATTSLPAVDRPNADRWNAARSCQLNYIDLHPLIPPFSVYSVSSTFTSFFSCQESKLLDLAG